MNKQFRLPDVGEGLTEADIVSWHVKPGDTVTINQVIVDIETAKAVVELPSPYAGTVTALLVEEGQTVDVGTPIITIDVPLKSGVSERSIIATRMRMAAAAPKITRARRRAICQISISETWTEDGPREGSWPAKSDCCSALSSRV